MKAILIDLNNILLYLLNIYSHNSNYGKYLTKLKSYFNLEISAIMLMVKSMCISV
jgi:hypothetical protein